MVDDPRIGDEKVTSIAFEVTFFRVKPIKMTEQDTFRCILPFKMTDQGDK